VVALHHLSHNAEFYAAGRLLRDGNGEQKLLYGPGAVIEELKVSGSRKILVLVPTEYLAQIRNFTPLKTEFIAENAETALILARAN
jgi:hypothetical protein